jgi:hypothetical protein
VAPNAIHTSVQSYGCGGIAAVSGAKSPTRANGRNRRWSFRLSGFSVATYAYIDRCSIRLDVTTGSELLVSSSGRTRVRRLALVIWSRFLFRDSAVLNSEAAGASDAHSVVPPRSGASVPSRAGFPDPRQRSTFGLRWPFRPSRSSAGDEAFVFRRTSGARYLSSSSAVTETCLPRSGQTALDQRRDRPCPRSTTRIATRGGHATPSAGVATHPSAKVRAALRSRAGTVLGVAWVPRR